jgi:MFS family permease
MTDNGAGAKKGQKEQASDAGGRRGPAALVSGLLPEPGPHRILAISTLVNTLGLGMFMTSSVLYFTRVVHLSPASVGFGLSAAGLVGIAAGIPIGDLADRRGPREVQLALLILLSLTMASYVLIHSFAVFVAVAAVDLMANNAANAVRGGLIRRVGGEGAASFRARLRATTNAGIAVGSLLAAGAIEVNTRFAYELLILGNAATFLLCAAVMTRLPHLEPLPRPERDSRWSSARDLPFNAWAVVNGLMTIQYEVLLIPLPLWIVTHTHAPRWSVACCMLINTLMCVFFQVKVGSGVKTIGQGARAYRTASCFFLVSCPLIGLLADVPGWAAVLLIAGGCVVHTTGELWHASGQFALSYELAPEHAQSQYQGMQGMWSSLLGYSLAPAFLTLLCIDGGQVGWFVLGGFFGMLGLVAVPVTKWAERTRGRYVLPLAPAAVAS